MGWAVEFITDISSISHHSIMKCIVHVFFTPKKIQVLLVSIIDNHNRQRWLPISRQRSRDSSQTGLNGELNYAVSFSSVHRLSHLSSSIHCLQRFVAGHWISSWSWLDFLLWLSFFPPSIHQKTKNPVGLAHQSWNLKRLPCTKTSTGSGTST